MCWCTPPWCKSPEGSGSGLWWSLPPPIMRTWLDGPPMPGTGPPPCPSIPEPRGTPGCSIPAPLLLRSLAVKGLPSVRPTPCATIGFISFWGPPMGPTYCCMEDIPGPTGPTPGTIPRGLEFPKELTVERWELKQFPILLWQVSPWSSHNYKL